MHKDDILYIDGQVFQTAAKDRGMGRYVSELLKNLPITKYHFKEIIFILNKNEEVDDTVINALVSIHEMVKIAQVDLKTTKSDDYENAERHNYSVLCEFIAQRPENKHFLMPVLFQEPTVCVFPNTTNNFLVFFDLVPYLYHEEYAPKMFYENYLKRFKYIFQADIIFTISNTVSRDLQTYLGIDADKIVNIDGAAINEMGEPQQPEMLKGVEKFILLPTGDDPRKNNFTTTRGYKLFIEMANQNTDYKLVVTSIINPLEKNLIKKTHPQTIFTGNMNEQEMKWLYKNCQLVLFVPEYEGLGLPVLEAVDNDKPVVCSSIAVFREISESAFYYCKKDDATDISCAIEECVTKGLRKDMAREYERIKSYYTWHRTSQLLLETIKKFRVKSSREKNKKPKIAVITPSPSGLSAIGKVVSETHPALDELFDVEYYFEDGLFSQPVRPNYLQYVAKCYSAKLFTIDDYKKYEGVIYHIGNGDFHVESIKNSLYLPGIAILHDTNLSEAYRVLKETGRISESRHVAEELLGTSLQNASFITSIVNSQLAVICHSRYAVDAVRDSLVNEVLVDKVELPTATTDLPVRLSNQRQPITIGLAGIIAGVKGIALIEELANNPKLKECRFMIFGFNFTDKKTTNRLKNLENVQLSPNLTDYQFSQKMAELDVFVNFRSRYNGETSLSTLEAMRQGVVVVVRKMGWYNELPDGTVMKATTQEDVYKCIERLLENPTLMSKISVEASSYVKNIHTHQQYAKGLQGIMYKISENHKSQNLNFTKKIKNRNINNEKDYLALLNEG